MDQTRWQQIENLYHAALERPPEERIRFLSDSCADDTDLYQQVHSLLSSNEQTDGFLAEPEFELGLKILTTPPRVLEKGQNFGNFTILDFLGRGGMGEVYLAQDARLGRLVALKVLPADVASDLERIRRFMQEARAASALNHPNILTIHEIGEADGWRFIASEFVEGETLRERLKRGKPLTGQETLEIALQIVAALNAAHKAGIIHRDVKPENIMLREDGLVKVLDFGLAKLTEKLAGQNSESDFVSTNPGMIMGTVAYMSPEQLRGQKTDTRSDVWSFGVVLYEMLAGRLPFKGDTTSDIIAAILTTEPVSSDKHLTEKPENLQQILGKALCKDPAQRYKSVKEIAEDLRKTRLDISSFSENDFFNDTDFRQIGQTDSRLVVTSDTLPHRQTDVIRKKRGKNRIIFAFASVVLLILAGGYASFNFLNISSRFAEVPMKITRVFDTGKTVNAVISPDGKYVVHALADAGKQSLWIKHIATNSNVQLAPPESASFSGITFSNDGNYIYYVKGGKSNTLYQVPVLGGDSKKILDNVDSSISFSPSGTQFTFLRWLSQDESALMVAESDGSGERQLITRSSPEAFGGSGVSWSPDGKFIAGSVFVKGESSFMSIALIPIDGGGDAKLISPQKWRLIEQVAWLPDGSGLLGAAVGEAGESLTQIWFFPISGEDARLITNDLNQYSGISLTADAKQLLTIHWQNRENIWLLPDGKTEDAKMLSNNIHARYRFIALTPDGRIVFPSNENAGDSRDIWIINPDGSNAKQLTANAGGNILPCVTGDGRYVVFASNRADLKTYHIWRMNMDGTNPVQLTNGGGERGPVCSPDGQTVFYSSGGPNVGPEKSRLWKTSIDGGVSVQLTDYPTGWKDISPDGKFIALNFKLDNASPFKLGIIPAAGGQPIKVFDSPKQNPQLRWRSDGRSITYIKTENGVSNIWEQFVSGEPAKPLTKFTSELILGFDWSRGNDLICARGYEARDPVLISNFK